MAEFAELRVLLVEDEGGVALLLEAMLGELGCEIANSVARVARAFEAVEAGAFDLAVLDVNVGGETSFDLARLLIERRTPIVFSTGYGVSGLPEDLRSLPVLSKPFSLEGLRSAIREALMPSR